MKTVLLGILLLTQNEHPVEDVTPTYWIVVSPETKLMAGDVPKGKVPPGTLLRCSKQSGNWRFSMEYRAWVHSNDLVALDKAVDFFSEIITKTPTAAAYQHRGIAHAAVEHWEEALADFNKAAELGDESIELLINLGNVQRHLNQSGLAVESYTKALKANPKATYALLHRGSLLGELGHWEASLKDLQEAADLSPESSEIHNHLGVALRMMGRHEDAIAAYSKAIDIVPNDALAYGNRGYALKSIGKYEEALKDYEQALKLDEKAPEVKNDLAWLLATCPDEAIRNPQRAIKLCEEVNQATEAANADFLDSLAAAYASDEQFEKAVQTAEKAAELIAGKPGAESIVERLALYREQKPFVEMPAEESN